MRTLNRRTVITLSALAALVYNSWPLGYWLNPAVARHDLASNLSAGGQPYNWLFTGGDILTGIVVLLLAAILWHKFGRTSAGRLLAIGYVLFGVFTAVSTLLPLGCSATDPRCGIYASQIFGPHVITGALASIGLFMSLIAGWAIAARQKVNNKSLRPLQLVTVVWSISGAAYIPLAITGDHLELSQQIFLVFSGLAIIAIDLVLDQTAIAYVLKK
jgi:hypothetical protein